MIWFVAFDSRANEPTPSQLSTQLNSANRTTAEVAVPEPSPKAARFYHSTTLLIAVIALWIVLIPVVFLFTGFSAKLRSWAERFGRRWYFTYSIYWTAFSLICFLLSLPLAFYGGYIHLHHYDLSNQSFARWLHVLVQIAAIVWVGGLALGWIPFFIIQKSPQRWWLYLGLLAPLYMCFTLWIQPGLIDPLYHKFTQLQDKELEAKIFAEARRAGIQGSRIYQVNTSVDTKLENAYVTGVMRTKTTPCCKT
jgi:STE24 endopeptidase